MTHEKNPGRGAKKKIKKETKPFEILTAAFLFVCATVLLLFTGKSGYSAISEAKFRIFAVISVTYILMFGLLIAELALVGKLKIPKLKSLIKETTWADRTAVIYLVFTWISALVSPFFPLTIVGASRYNGALVTTLYVFIFLLVSHFYRPEKYVVIGFSSAVTLCNALSFLQFTGKNPFILYPEGLNYYDAGTLYSGEHLGTIGNVDLLAAFYCLAIPFFLFMLLRRKEKSRFWLLIPLVSSVIVLILMRVLAGYVGTLLGILIMLPIALPLQKRQRKIIAVCLALLLVTGLLVLYIADIGDGLFHELHEVMNGNISDEFGSGRIRIWKNVLSKLRGNLLIGHGPDTMILCDIEPFTRIDSETGAVITAQIDSAHNEYLNILFDAGIPALVSYLAFLTSVFVIFYKRKKAALNYAAAGGAFCYIIGAFFGISTCAVAPLFWICLALAVNKKALCQE